MNISPAEIENHKNTRTLLEAEVNMREAELAAWKKRGEAERNLYSWIADVSADPSVKRTPLRAYHEAHKEHYAVQGDLKQLEILKLRSQHAILTALITEAEKIIKDPDKALITMN
jgi:hypothetical protein